MHSESAVFGIDDILTKEVILMIKRDINGSNPDRWKDPYAWDCLTDEQREVINQWYEYIVEDRRKSEKNREDVVFYASMMALIPFAVLWTYTHSLDAGWIDIILGFLIAWCIICFVFFGFFNICSDLLKNDSSKFQKVWYSLCVIFASLCIVAMIFR